MVLKDKENKQKSKLKVRFCDTKTSELNSEEETGEQLLPQISEALSFPDPELRSYYEALSNRIIYITNEITSDYLLSYSKLIFEFNREDKDLPIEQRQPIKFLLYTPGGELDAALHFMEICRISKTPIYTYNLGICYSGGTAMLLAGTKRFALRNSQALIHCGSGVIDGNYDQVQKFAKQYQKKIEFFTQYLLRRTKISAKEYNKHKNEEWFLNDEEQKKFGIVDEMIESIDDMI